MPIQGRTIVDLREEMARRAWEDRYSLSEVAEMFEVARPTVRLWRDRYRQFGRAGLEDRSHAPKSCPHRTDPAIEALIVAEREQWGFGSKKILKRLEEAHPKLSLPKRSTVDAILSRHQLVKQVKRRRRQGNVSFMHRYEANEPGELTTIDFKGQFRLGNGSYCFPLTMADSVSRFLLACEALPSLEFAPTWRVIERVFREHGLPRAMQSDNGPPFGPTHGRLSVLSVRLMSLGVQPVFSRPGRPGDNGRHERMHRDLKDRTTHPPSKTLPGQQRQLKAFQKMYNEERPHEGIGMRRPARLYKVKDPRPYPTRIPKPDYPIRFETRRVAANGEIGWNGTAIFMSRSLAGQTLAFEPIDDAIWAVHFYRFVIGKIDDRKKNFI